MPEINTLLLFTLAAMALVAVPGPNVIFIITVGINQGRRAAVASGLGVESTMLVHVVLASVGISALLASSELLFNVLRFAGAAYLVWLGVQAWRNPVGELGQLETVKPNYRRLFAQGALINVLNPKVALFCLAFLPQFVDPSQGNAIVQMLILGLILNLIGILGDLGFALTSGSIGNWLQGRRRIAGQRGRFAGVMYILLGASAAFTGSHRT